ncbi:sulfotransferase [Bradyrhizobium sp. RDT10]
MPEADPFPSSPVLLGGDNRSGTTLLSVVLDSHPDLVIGPEIDFLEPPNLGPHILRAIDLLDARDPKVTGTTKARSIHSGTTACTSRCSADALAWTSTTCASWSPR